MKKLKVLLVCIVFTSFVNRSWGAWSDENLVNRSSFTQSNETIAISSNNLQGGVFVGVIISSPIGNGSVSFFDSNQGLVVSTIGIVSMSGVGSGSFYVPFEVRLSSGLTYKTSGNSTSTGVTIIYKITKPI